MGGFSSALRRDGLRRAEEFRRSLSQRGITVDGLHVVTGKPEKALVALAAKKRIGLAVLGCVGRRKLAGRVIGNTARCIEKAYDFFANQRDGVMKIAITP